MGSGTSESVEILNPSGSGAVLVLCEHASNHIPARYAGLGLAPGNALSHAAWDPGARALSILISAALDAPFVAGRVSRLVYDCNRPPEDSTAIPERVERIEVPGNRSLTEADRAERIATVYRPFCTAVTDLITARGPETILVTIHSFSPTWFGKARDVEIGILHDSDSRLADAMLARVTTLPHRDIRRNAPYGPVDGVTHSLKQHGLAHGLANVMIEVRNDLLSDTTGQQAIADELLALLRPALAQIQAAEADHA